MSDEETQLINYINWEVKPLITWITNDDTGEKSRVCKVQRKDGLWQVVPMAFEQVLVVYAFATFGRA